MDHIVNLGIIKDRRSVKLIREQCDKFKKLSIRAKIKADEKEENELGKRLKSLKVSDVNDCENDEDYLRSRFEKLTGRSVAGSNVSNNSLVETNGIDAQEALAVRLKCLGSSQFPHAETLLEDPEVRMLLYYADRKGYVSEDDTFTDMKSSQIQSYIDTICETSMYMPTCIDSVDGNFAHADLQENEINTIIQQAKDYARFSDPQSQSCSTGIVNDRDSGLDTSEDNSYCESSDTSHDNSFGSDFSVNKIYKKNNR